MIILTFIWMFFITLSLYKVSYQQRQKIEELEYKLDVIDYNINILGINDYQLILTNDGRELTTEEDFQLHNMQIMMNESAQDLGFDFVPYPRPPEASID